MRTSRPRHPFLGLLGLIGLVVVASLGVGACGGAAPAGTGSQPASAPASAPVSTPADASPAASPEASGGAIALPEACVAAIREYLISIEPIVSGVDWQGATEVPPQIADQLGSEEFDPDVCPDVSVAEAHAAWSAIATEVAPGALDYIDFIYRP